ncbi:hypothetical protein [Mycobacterium interjectum]|uniref:hypothetical protein n=1 Tax=Mycobacterium interjectum TaxID=33895 RepID=UPI000A7AB321|nr:hypothetical protein [Mycobacterium interjectum]
MDTARTLRALIAKALLAGGIAVAGLGLGAGSAEAQPGPAPLNHFTCCPGHPDPNDHISPGVRSSPCSGRAGI